MTGGVRVGAGRKPSATIEQKRLQGNPGRRPLVPIVPPVPTGGLMVAPRHVTLNERADHYWRHILSNVSEAHLGAVDAPQVARYAMACAMVDLAFEELGRYGLTGQRMRGRPRKFDDKMVRHWQGVLAVETNNMIRLGAELLLSVQARNRLGKGFGGGWKEADKPERPADPADKYF